jgi:hypothetical protein
MEHATVVTTGAAEESMPELGRTSSSTNNNNNYNFKRRQENHQTIKGGRLSFSFHCQPRHGFESGQQKELSSSPCTQKSADVAAFLPPKYFATKVLFHGRVEMVSK